jgi:hypothetical protein
VYIPGQSVMTPSKLRSLPPGLVAFQIYSPSVTKTS